MARSRIISASRSAHMSRPLVISHSERNCSLGEKSQRKIPLDRFARKIPWKTGSKTWHNLQCNVERSSRILLGRWKILIIIAGNSSGRLATSRLVFSRGFEIKFLQVRADFSDDRAPSVTMEIQFPRLYMFQARSHTVAYGEAACLKICAYSDARFRHGAEYA